MVVSVEPQRRQKPTWVLKAAQGGVRTRVHTALLRHRPPQEVSSCHPPTPSGTRTVTCAEQRSKCSLVTRMRMRTVRRPGCPALGSPCPRCAHTQDLRALPSRRRLAQGHRGTPGDGHCRPAASAAPPCPPSPTPSWSASRSSSFLTPERAPRSGTGTRRPAPLTCSPCPQT